MIIVTTKAKTNENEQMKYLGMYFLEQLMFDTHNTYALSLGIRV